MLPACGRSGPHGKLSASCSTRKRRSARTSPATADHGVQRDGSRGARPLGLLRRGPASGTSAVCYLAFWTPRPNAPVFADASGPGSRRAIRARNLTSHRSSLRRPRGAASYAPNLSCHTLPLRAETHKYTTYRSCNGRQPQPIPARRIQQCSGSTCCWGSRRGRRRSSRHDPRRCTRRPRRRGRHSSRRAAARSRGRRGTSRGATLV